MKLKDQPNYGVYLGKHSDGWIIAIKTFFELTGFIQYPTLEALRQEWELD